MPRRVLASKYALLESHESELIGQFTDSLGVLSPRRIKKYQFYLGKINNELGKPFEYKFYKAISSRKE